MTDPINSIESVDPHIEQQMSQLDIKAIDTIGGTGKPDILQYIVLTLADDSTQTYHMREANHAYRWLLQNKLEIIEAWRARTGITSF